MNKFYSSLILLFLFFTNTILAQDLPKETIVTNNAPVIIDEDGNQIEGKAFLDLLSSGEWTLDPSPMNDTLKLMRVDRSMIGTMAPFIEASDLSANKIDTKNSRGKILVLNFWFAACKPCIEEIPELNKVYNTFQNSDKVEFISITFENEEASQKFKSQHNLLYPVVAERRDICEDYGVVGYPTNVVLNEKGEFYFFESGGSPDIGKVITSAINRALEGKPSLQLPTEK